MRRDPAAWALAGVAVGLWALLIAAPLGGLYLWPNDPPITSAAAAASLSAGVIVRSFVLAAALAAISVVLGWMPARLLGTARRGRGVLMVLLLAPLMVPRYLLLYAWDLLRSPTAPLGQFLSARPAWSRAAAAVTSSMVLVLWCWPLAALLMAQGWRAMGRDVHQSARLEAGAARRLTDVTLPLLAPAILLAFGVCFVLLLGEFATFHLAGIETIGTQLAVLYEETGSVGHVARSAWPAGAAALVVAVALWRRSADWSAAPPIAPPDPPRRAGAYRLVLAALLMLTIGLPVILLATAVRDAGGFANFYDLHREQLGTSALAAAAGGVAAVAMAAGALVLEGLGRGGRALTWLMHPTILLAALLPGSLIGASLVGLQAALRAGVGFQEGWWSVSAGLAARLGGIALILLRLGGSVRSRHLAELAAADGAGWSRTWWSVHLPTFWQIPAAALLLVTMLGLTELSATTVLLPAGVPNFAQGLLNQMHYARDQQVIATCLVLAGGYAAMLLAGGAGWAVTRAARRALGSRMR